MKYSDEQLKDLREQLSGLSYRKFSSILTKAYHNEKAREYAEHGFHRRICMLRRGIENIFNLCPPDQHEEISPDQAYDISINLQSFIVNLYGAVDNLAHIWVAEKNITHNGRELVPQEIGLTRRHVKVRSAFSSNFRLFLEENDEWFDYIKDFRDSLAHRIPLYIPPKTVLQGKGFVKEGFVPIMLHSFRENSPTVFFHAQVLLDFKRLEQFSIRFLEELETA